MQKKLSKLMHYYSVVGVRGAFSFCLAKLLGTRPLFSVRAPKISYPIFVRLATTDVSVVKQVLFEKHYDFPVKRTPRTIIDAGANIGVSAVYFANRFPEAKIVAVEPESSNFELLKRNASPYPNIVPIQAAIWYSNDEVVSVVDPGSGNHGFQTSTLSKEQRIDKRSVQAVTIEKIMNDAGWQAVDLLKIDIEGAEKEVFEYSKRWIGSVGMIMIELHEDLRPGCSASFAEATGNFDSVGRRGESLMLVRKD